MEFCLVTVWALLPPVIAIVLALITKEVYMVVIYRCRNRSSFIYKFQSGWNDRGNF